jgi:hypothetical protein
MRKTVVAGAAAIGLVLGSQAANADYFFAGAGLSGDLGVASETWVVGSPSPPPGTFGWGSPGVGLGTTTYGREVSATNFEITFFGNEIDRAQIAVGDGAGCVGTDIGGTTFCSEPFGTPWTAVLEGPSSIAFFAPAGVTLDTGESYFVNIFLVGQEGPVAFEGRWSTIPEPGTLALLGVALAGFGVMRRRKSA